MTKVKICGITNSEDALLSAKFGADALGFNFYVKSPRYIEPEKAREIIEQIPEEVLKVGVFVNESFEKIAETASMAKLDALQLHGEETPEFARELKAKTNLEIIKAFRVSPDFKPEDVLQYDTDAILLDAYNPKEHGGTGETFDWEIAKRVREIFPKMYLAGGLSHDNIAKAILQVQPFAVDACSGLESEKGKKDKVKTINFISNLTFTDQTLQADNKLDLLNLLRHFRSRPELYFPAKSITQICSFMCGYYSAIDKPGADFIAEDKLFREFDEWLNLKRGLFIHGLFSYSTYFLEKCDGDEEKAFDLFFANLEEFLLEKDELFGKKD